MDGTTKEKLAEFICGDDEEKCPIYRSSSYLTKYFQDIGLNYTHDGSTRKWWVLDVLNSLKGPDLQKVILRLASPKLYGGNVNHIRLALKTLNEILAVESLKIKINGVEPNLIRETPNFNFEEDIENKENELIPLPHPDFKILNLEVGIADILERRWDEIQKCIDNEANLASVILMGSLLEGFLLGVMLRFPRETNNAHNAPKNKEGKVKKFPEWTLREMIDVAHSIGWIELDVKKFSHALRDFRNIIHPYQQLAYKTFPDIDTCKISWLVVQAACNDIAKWMQKYNTK
jgi:hypothetical protein